MQRASSASVSVDGRIAGQLDRPGLMVLLGITHSDGENEVAQMARKLAHLRILHDERSAVDEHAPILLVSQFTLYGDTGKGRRPTWSAAAPGPVAQPLVDAVAMALRGHGLDVQTGVFGAQMAVELVNDGPFTVIIDL